ncbi:MAG: two-component sensor histidine kinase [Oscillospiraceae bacterium]|jgi:two-component system phosphate regulon sensor histidine kinase PhoR|nr:two-component sensor histidine kinase [Oscillospiraceae bacterium]
MRRSILRFSCAVAGLSVFVTAILISLYAYFGFSERTRRDVRARAEYIAAEADSGGFALSGLRPDILPGSRVTLISATGEVRFDTAGDTGAMENHLDRPEVKSALATGFGECTRFSRTLRERTYYCAIRLRSGDVLRCATTSDSIIAALPGIAAITGCIAAAVFSAAVFVSSRVTHKLVAPINSLDLEANDGIGAYPELGPLLTRLRELRGEIVSQIEDREKMRREFSANVSHELKTPITAISGYAEILANGVARQEDTRNFAGKIFDEAQRLIALVNDVMLVSHLDEGGADFSPERVSLLSLAREAAARFARTAAARGISVAAYGDDLAIMGYRRILDETVSNLVDNAIKYNRDKGRVSITVEDVGGGTALTVTDTGAGIAPEDQERVFERFYRADKSREAAPGTGLGLAIVKHAAQLHGAKIDLRSDGETGTSVKITFPQI